MENENGVPKYFISPSRGRRCFSEVVDDIIEFITEDDKFKYTVIVGTDSEQGNGTAEFVSVIVVHRHGKYGRYFWKKTGGIRMYDRHDRILKEASFSLDLAQEVVSELRAKLQQHLYDFEIHLDIGQNGPTKTMISEIVGMVTGNGFTAKIKPDSYAANKVADRHVHPVKKSNGTDASSIKYPSGGFIRSKQSEKVDSNGGYPIA